MLRLTLRTLLAYLDDTLSPAEARDIGHQIAQEPSLNDLIVRIKSVMKRRRLMADSPDPDEAKLDPNDMAEYLDSVLSPARVVELEKRLLENDQDLAEAASVHQILSLVLGKPAEISSAARAKAYRLVPRTRSHTELDPIGPKRNQSTKRDDREPRVATNPFTELSLESEPSAGRLGTIAMVSLLLLALIAMVYITLSDAPETKPAIAMNRQKPSVPAAAGAEEPQEAEPAPLDAQEVGDAKTAADKSPADAVVAAPNAEGAKETGVTAVPIDPLEEHPTLEPLREPVAPPPVPESEPAPSETPAAPIEVAKADTTKPTDIVPSQPDRKVQVATYTSPTGILLRRSEGQWQRIQSQDQIHAGDRIVVPENERATIEFPMESIAELYGPTRIDFAFDPASDIALRLIDGRMVLTTAELPRSVSLPVTSERPWNLFTNDGSVRIAAEATLLEFPTALAPEREIVRAVELYVLDGAVEVTNGDVRKTIPMGNRVRLTDSEQDVIEPEPSDEPAWTQQKIEPSLSRAVSRIGDGVSYGSAVEESYRRLVDSAPIAARPIVVSTLAQIDDVDAVVRAMKHDRGDVRAVAVASLQSLAHEGGESLKSVQLAVRRAYSDAVAKQMNDLLLGFTREDCENAAIRRQLVDYLMSNELEVREAAIYNLRQITGDTMGFAADDLTAARKRQAQRWESWVEKANSQGADQPGEKRLLVPGED